SWPTFCDGLDKERRFPLQVLAFRGAGGEPPRRKRCGVSPVPLLPQESRTSAPITLNSFVLKFTKRAFFVRKKGSFHAL
ncbi:hypothetical protein, partial [Peribacillus frigoritolerans]|uniref:hypothetical protein n=1 Tax=Peribacillus frigoritolerans TaxID=450367 RepID=UPI002E1A0B17|nr:hypothetical protein [Peribacillus frigoritolerans]